MTGRIRNLRTITDADFLDGMTVAMLSAIEANNAPLAFHWARDAASFAVSSGMLS